MALTPHLRVAALLVAAAVTGCSPGESQDRATGGASAAAPTVDLEPKALLQAAAKGDLPLLQRYAEAGGDLEVDLGGRSTLLQTAAHFGKKAVVEYLIDQGADISAADENGWTALHRAAINNQPPVVVVLIENGADVNAKAADGGTPLSFARTGSSSAVIRLLEEAGAR